MTPELIAVLAVGVALAGLILATHRATHAEIAALRGDIATLRDRLGQLEQRIARLEGLFEGFIQRRPEAAE